MLKKILLAGAGLLVLAPTHGWAQAAEPRTATLDEVVVTAQRRSESIQEVPVSITAITEDQIVDAGVSGTQDLAQVTPGLVFGRSSAFAQPTIRGIGSRSAGLGDEPNVAMYIDGVYQPLQAANVQELTALERVEVLKGPQGTLFGRNATGGAINIITKRPSFVPTGSLTASYGRFNYQKVTAYVSGPLSDTFAASLDLVGVKDDGYIDNIFLDISQNPRRSAIARGKLIWAPTDKVEIGLNGLTSYWSDNSTFSGHIIDGNTSARRTANPENYPLNIIVPSGEYETATAYPTRDVVRQEALDLHGTFDLGWAHLAVLASVADTDVYTKSDTDLSPLVISGAIQNQDALVYTQEALLTSAGEGRVSWVLGINAIQDKQKFSPSWSNFERVSVTQVNFLQTRTEAWSVFGDMTYQLTEKLYISGGLRYNDDLKTALHVAGSNGSSTYSEAADTALTVRAVARYELSPDTNVYASFSQGYKSPAYNPLSPTGAAQAADAETVNAYEVGIKTDLTPSLRLNAAAYHYDYADLQANAISLRDVNGVPTVFSFLQNAPSAKINGLEVEAQYVPTANLSLTVGLSLLDTEIEEFPNATVTMPSFFDADGQPQGNASVSTDVAGNELLRAPNWSFNLGFNYVMDLAQSELVFAGNAMFSDNYYVELLNRLEQPQYEVVNASVTWRPVNSGLSLTAFGQNLTDERVSKVIFTSGFGDYTMFEKPRWFGVKVGYEF